MQNIDRSLQASVVQALSAFPAVYIAGPRQSGKTTLVQHIADSVHPAKYLSFDDLQLRSAAERDAEALLRSFTEPVILDEIQLAPGLFRPLKIIIDANRQRSDGGRGRFLLTGSASILALPALSDALVGRMALHTLLPFSTVELQPNSRSSFVDRAFSQEWNFAQFPPQNLLQTILRATFPELSTLETTALRYDWCNSYINTILHRDVRALMEVEKISVLPDLLRLLAARTGGLLNEVSLSRDSGLNHITAKKYRILLDGLFLTQTVPAWSSNFGKRLIKSPKVYIADLNLLAYLLNTDLDNLANSNHMLWGQVVENFVAVELAKQLTFAQQRASLYHYRTASGQEVDFILEGKQQHIVGLEVKAKTKVTAKDFLQLEALKKDLGEKFQRGFVIYLGSEIIPFGADLWALPLAALWSTAS